MNLTYSKLSLCCNSKTVIDVRKDSMHECLSSPKRLLLMMGVLFCCGTGFFIRRRMYPSPLPEDTFNVSFTRHPMTAPGLQQPAMQNYGDPGGTNLSSSYPIQAPPHPSHMAAPYHHPPPPAYCNLPPPPYEQVLQTTDKRETGGKTL
ncbi:vesicular, overexpressed in cancer, prosurvival protein 1 isoform X2 [Esox lucius]|uniref:vesicular, overexpressed in cancer, prosurvival protein 1 isoform X2 n=1 Tax=Esox lucius TaxID=8010 RepID=UPI0009732824|nr:vesicular, overexpressed in cancer, prosurvival protein 1 isoform X2 [Esox lucius]